MEKNNSVKGNLFAAAGAAGWGVSGVCSQYLFSEYQMESDWLTAVRMILSGVILLALVLPREKQRLLA